MPCLLPIEAHEIIYTKVFDLFILMGKTAVQKSAEMNLEKFMEKKNPLMILDGSTGGTSTPRPQTEPQPSSDSTNFPQTFSEPFGGVAHCCASAGDTDINIVVNNNVSQTHAWENCRVAQAYHEGPELRPAATEDSEEVLRLDCPETVLSLSNARRSWWG